MSVRALFEDELKRRGLFFTVDASGRYSVEIQGRRQWVGIENLQREIARDGDAGRVSRFLDAIVGSASFSDEAVSADQFYWCLEPNDYVEKADFRVAVS